MGLFSRTLRLLVIVSALLPGFARSNLGTDGAYVLVDLHRDAESSWAFGIADGQQVGATQESSGHRYARLWNESKGTYVDLHPPEFDRRFYSSEIFATDGVRQVGQAYRCAFIWEGTRESAVSLHPERATWSVACAVSGTRAVGWIRHEDDSKDRAVLWSGAAHSLVILHPEEANQSFAYGVAGTQVVGVAAIPGKGAMALIWPDESPFYYSLHNPGIGMLVSTALATDGIQQVGFAAMRIAGKRYEQRPILWWGSAESAVDLTPPDSDGLGMATGVVDGLQVGQAMYGGTYEAVVWAGTAASAKRLSSYMGTAFGESCATAIAPDGTISGYALHKATGRYRAVMWKPAR